MNAARQGVLLVLGAGILWGTTGTAQALGPVDSHPLAVGALRALVGAAALALLVAARGELRSILRLPWRAALVGGAGVAAYQWSFFAAVKLAGIATGTLVAIGSAPLFIALLAWRRPTAAWAAATAVALAGLVTLGVARGAEGGAPLGLALALAAGASYAAYAVACSRMAGTAPPDAIMAGVFTLGALLLAPALLIAPTAWAATPSGALMVLHLGVVALAVAYALFARGLERLDVATVGTLSLMEPLTATLLAVVLVGEALPPLAWLGVALLAAGLAALARTQPPARAKADSVA